MKAVTEFVKDYNALMGESNKFYKKHWKGVILMNVGVIGVCFGTCCAIGAVYELKEKLKSKKNDDEIEEKETDDKTEFHKSTEETFRVLRGGQRS